MTFKATPAPPHLIGKTVVDTLGGLEDWLNQQADLGLELVGVIGAEVFIFKQTAPCGQKGA